MEPEWAMFRGSIVEAAGQSCGQKAVGACHGGTRWWIPAVKKAIRLKEAHPVYVCFVDLEKAYDCVPQGILWGILREYGLSGPLVRVIWSLYKQSESCVRILSTKSRTFSVCVELRQGCPLSPIPFVIFMDRISRRSRGEESVRFGDLRIASVSSAVAGLSLRDRVRSSDIRRKLGVEPLLLRVERSQLRWFGI